MERITAMDEKTAINEVIKDMWHLYDDNDSGGLDFEELKSFCLDALGAMNYKHIYSDAAFKIIFKKFDIDGNGLIEKDEIK